MGGELDVGVGALLDVGEFAVRVTPISRMAPTTGAAVGVRSVASVDKAQAAAERGRP